MSLPRNCRSQTILRKLIQQFPDNTDLMQEIGNLYREEGHYARALKYYHKAKRLRGVYPETEKAMAYCYLQLSQFKKAAKHYQAAYGKTGFSFSDLILYGSSLQGIGQYRKALRFHQLAFEENPASVDNLNALAYCLQELSHPYRALDYYLMAHHLDGQNDLTLLNMSWCFLQIKQITKARRYARLCLEQNSQNKLAWVNLGHTYLCEGRSDIASMYYNNSLVLFEDKTELQKIVQSDIKNLGHYPIGRSQVNQIIKNLHITS